VNEQQMVKAVQSHFSDFSAEMENRAQAMIKPAIEMFASRRQWEFLDVYWETETEVQSSSGKTRIKMPSPNDWFKPVAMGTETGGPISYQDRADWLDAQRSSADRTPRKYTLIGRNYYLSGSVASTTTIRTVYTRTAGAYGLEDIADTYHPAIMHAAILLLTPGSTPGPNNRPVPNPAWDRAEAMYNKLCTYAKSQEQSIKGRTRYLKEPEVSRSRSSHR
jgi:hypothetical protein